mgnify:CR=1 FL=1
MKIAISGNGKMGKRIGELAKINGDTIVATSSSKNPTNTLDLCMADVAIDFSTPTSAFDNIAHAINSGIPVISGTTGWLEKKKEIEKLCTNKEGAFLYASNFSLGMNLFFQLNKQLAKLMKNQNYESKIHEIHHLEKLDSPSGTAKTLANDLQEIFKKEVRITAEREENVAGTHSVIYSSAEDEIKINHTAKNRDGFAIGAIVAAEWIIGKKGIFTMNDVLKMQ